MYAATQITCMVPIVSLGVFMPSIIKGMGFSDLQGKVLFQENFNFNLILLK